MTLQVSGGRARRWSAVGLRGALLGLSLVLLAPASRAQDGAESEAAREAPRGSGGSFCTCANPRRAHRWDFLPSWLRWGYALAPERLERWRYGSAPQPVPQVVYGVVAQGPLKQERAEQALEAMAPQYAYCVSRWRRQGEGRDAPLSANVAVGVDATGAVTWMEIASAEIEDLELLGCLEGRTMRLRFEQRSDPGGAVVSYMLQFEPD
ncbi:MAG: hypothetical protein H6740_11015 [Alphaproteobacteria bacterium]|nr:hypothetical protein [Alphaproteobacteria bacterium]